MAHRFSYELAYGPIPKGMFVCHHCDNRACCNPAHMFLGTNADNMADMATKGRSCKGSKSGRAKLTEEQVRELKAQRAAGATQVAIAKQYGVSRRAIREILAGRNWRHIK
ncbi:MAG: HNH endonuclease [Parcubacteria group bacterium]